MTINPILAHGANLIPAMVAFHGCIALLIAVFMLCSRNATQRKNGKISLWWGVGLILASIILLPLVSKL